MKFYFMMIIFLSMSVRAQVDSNGDVSSINYDEIFGSGISSFEFEKFSDDSVLLSIEKDMQFSCNKKGLCVLSGMTTTDHRFTTQFNIGEGFPYGGFNSGNGTTVILPGDIGQSTSAGAFYGVTLRYTRSKCNQEVQVPRSLYISMNRYLYALMNDDGGVRRGFSPADEAMIMFYTTITKLASGCRSGD